MLEMKVMCMVTTSKSKLREMVDLNGLGSLEGERCQDPLPRLCTRRDQQKLGATGILDFQ